MKFTDKIKTEFSRLLRQVSRSDLKRYLKVYRISIPAGIGVLIGVYFIFSLFIGNKKDSNDVAVLVPEVKSIIIEKGLLQNEINTPGSVTYLEKAAVNSKIPGRVEKLFAHQGQIVRRGERLAKMETFELKIKLHQTQAAINSAAARLQLNHARYKNARRNTEKKMKSIERMQGDILSARSSFLNARQNLLNKKEIYGLGGVSKSELKSVYSDYIASMARYFQSRKDYQASVIGYRTSDLPDDVRDHIKKRREIKNELIGLNTEVEKNELKVARAAYNSARLEMRNIRLLLKEATIRAPLAGVVASRTIEIGEEIKPGEPLFTIVRMDRLLISANIAARELRFIKKGQKVRLKVDAREGRILWGSVYQISPIIDLKTRTAEVKILTDNKQGELNPGMFVRCSILTQKKQDGIALPDSAIINRRKKNEQLLADVFIIRKGLSFRRAVILGDMYGDKREVLSGIKAGEEVAISGVMLLKDGAVVRVIRPLPDPEQKKIERSAKNASKMEENKK